jgi:sulfur carrier protein
MQLEAGRLITVLVNGERTQTGATSLGELVAQLGFGENQVATALNGDFVARQERARTKLAADDSVEIVAPRQGG